MFEIQLEVGRGLGIDGVILPGGLEGESGGEDKGNEKERVGEVEKHDVGRNLGVGSSCVLVRWFECSFCCQKRWGWRRRLYRGSDGYSYDQHRGVYVDVVNTVRSDFEGCLVSIGPCGACSPVIVWR